MQDADKTEWYHPRKGAKTARLHRVKADGWYHPRKGAKTALLSRRVNLKRYHPRKGAKTSTDSRCEVEVQYHPRKGAKTMSPNRGSRSTGTIPVRGQKNSASKKMRSFSFANLNSLFSVGCPSMNGTIAAAMIFSLLRLLHSDKMCYNKANSKHLLQNQQIHFPFIVQFFHDP